MTVNMHIPRTHYEYEPRLIAVESEMTPDGVSQAPYENEHPHESEGVFLLRSTQLVQGQVEVDGKRSNWTLEIPEGELAYDGIAHFIPGYGGIKQTSRAPRGALASRGYATLTSDAFRGGVLCSGDDIRDPQRLHTRGQLAIAADLRNRRDEIVRKYPNGSNIDFDKKLLIPHSMGGAPAVAYAETESNAVDMIINLATIGRGSPTLKDFLHVSPLDVAASIRHELVPAIKNGAIEMNVQNLYKIVHYYARLRAVLEARSCLTLDLSERLADLQSSGIIVRNIDFEHDILVPTPPWRADVMMNNMGHLAPQCKAQQVAGKIIQLEHERFPIAA